MNWIEAVRKGWFEMDNKAIAVVLIALLGGLIGGYGLGYVIYQPQIQSLQNDMDNLRNEFQLIDDTINAGLGNLQTSLSALNTNLNAINSSLGDLQTSISTLNTDLTAFNSSLEDIQSSVATLNTELDSINSTVANLASAPSDWAVEEVAAGEVWTCPEGKYEIYIASHGINCDFYLNSGYLCYVYTNDDWYPMDRVSYTYWDLTPDGAGGYTATNIVMFNDTMMSTHGWEVSTSDVVRDITNQAFYVRYRKIG